MKVDFWQLSRDPAEQVAVMIARKVRASGERLLVVAKDSDQLDRIGKLLWETAPGEFLANGRADAAGAQHQPILLAPDCTNINHASHVVFADGEWRSGAAEFDRSFLLFGEDRLEDARATWRSLDGAEGLERSFMRQDDGKWVKVA
ncbi:DNA polymerase III subunit chi [Altererythrobacter aquiaggeris]|uniref:DNA polymerase III subunit chi n=1 Tax=Aestuarierythrobacter aquiaggeris TaxID=1898396 RepID=UPI0030168077